MKDNEKKKIRRSQLLTPFGVGAIVPFPGDESLIIGGLDKWKCESSHYEIKDERLTRRLGVASLRLPPEYIQYSGRYGVAAEPFANITIPAYRFPTLYFCRHCGLMTLLEPDNMQPQPLCPVCSNKQSPGYEKLKEDAIRLLPERFIVACPEGHLSDLPVARMVHSVNSNFDSQSWNTDFHYRLQHPIIRKTTDRSSLAGVRYFCKDDPEKYITLSGMTKAKALSPFIAHCAGKKPWLGEARDPECPSTGENLMLVQRGGSNVWFPEIMTSIYLPPNLKGGYDSRMTSLIEEKRDYLIGEFEDTGAIPMSMIKILCKKEGLDLASCLEYCKKNLFAKPLATVANNCSESDYRYEEYEALRQNCGKDQDDLLVINHPIAGYDKAIQPYFQSVSLVQKMKQTQALIGFSRLTPKMQSVADFRKSLSEAEKDWVPAVQSKGEGIFIAFDETRIAEWIAAHPEVETRAKMINDAKSHSFFGEANPELVISPSYLLIHTFAHLLINALSKLCGYGSSSLRERLYISDNVGKTMKGVLIYTTSSSSEGSLGGLIKEGLPGHLEDIILSALEEARWCSSDPICISSKGQGPDSCNLAACHNCALLPETCCEVGNKFLDRGCVIGLPDKPEIGYFNQ